ncbi:MAG: hypothetical protein ACR2NA_13325 [Solirubrobacterales bacterium]
MRDLVLRESLGQFAEEASYFLTRLVEHGAEVPYEVVEEGAGALPLYEYRPLVDTFLRRHIVGVRGLDGFGPLCAAVEASGVAGGYLEYLGHPVPPAAKDRREALIVTFLGRVWRHTADFNLEPDRVQTALEELERSYERPDAGVEVVCPIVGLRTDEPRIEVGDIVLLHAHAADGPSEARRPEGLGRSSWEPQVMAWVRCSDAAEGPPATVALAQLRHLVSLLRLFAPGGVALGPHAWTRRPGGSWQRVATGSGAVRPGGYTLADSDLEELVGLAHALSARPLRRGALAWAISRFESGCERISPLDGLSDQLLALRGLLDGGGPAGVGKSLRVAALCAEPADRMDVKALVDGADTLEHGLMLARVEPDDDAIALALRIEELTRAIVRDAATGHLGSDLRATADEILLADGFTTGQPNVELSEPQPAGDVELPWSAPAAEELEQLTAEPPASIADDANDPMVRLARLLPSPPAGSAGVEDDWFESDDETLDFPAAAGERDHAGPPAERRGRHLFPVPDTTDWSVGEPPEELAHTEAPAFEGIDRSRESGAGPAAPDPGHRHVVAEPPSEPAWGAEPPRAHSDPLSRPSRPAPPPMPGQQRLDEFGDDASLYSAPV